MRPDDDGFAAAHWGLARAYEGLHREKKAFEELKKTVQLDATNLDARVKMGDDCHCFRQGQARDS